MKLLCFLFLVSSLNVSAQETKLSYPYPVKQIERLLVLPENLDTLKQDYYLIYQFNIENGFPVSVKLVHQFPEFIPKDYLRFAERKLKEIDFSAIVNNKETEFYGTSLQLKKKKIEQPKISEIQLTYEEKFNWITLTSARYAGLKPQDYDYMISKGFSGVIVKITVDTTGKMNFENFSENREENKDQHYWEIYKSITDGIESTRIWNQYKNPFVTEDEFTIYLSFYKKAE